MSNYRLHQLAEEENIENHYAMERDEIINELRSRGRTSATT